MAVALWLVDEIIKSIKQRQTMRRFSPESERLFKVVMATQQGDPGRGSGDALAMKLEQEETRAFTVVQSADKAAGNREIKIRATPIANNVTNSLMTEAEKNGRDPWEYAEGDRGWNEMYNEGVASDARLVAGVLVKECKHVFEGLKTMVDVGGGTGMVATAAADAFPGLKCVVLELPHVVAGLEGSENLSFVCGDMMEFIPHADAVFLKWNLHMWAHDDAVKLLSKCKEAINQSKNNGGKVIIVEMVLDNQKEDHKATETQYLFDMHLMARFAGGGERSEKEWAQLFFDAGFASYKITPF